MLIVAVAGNSKTKKWEHIPIPEVNLGLNQPASFTHWSQQDACFYLFKQRSPDQGQENKDRCISDSCYMTKWDAGLAQTAYQHRGPVLVSSLHMPLTAIAPHSSPGQPHFASSEYLWMLLGVHIPLSGRLPGMGLQILSPCSCLSGSLALHPIAVCIAQCLAATSVAGVMRKNERPETVWTECGKQSNKKE